MRAYID